jgi:hypothetical protein
LEFCNKTCDSRNYATYYLFRGCNAHLVYKTIFH